MTAMVLSILIFVFGYGSEWLMLVLFCLFIFLAPLICMGIYAISAQIERQLTVSFGRTLRACLKWYIGNELVFILVLVVIFLVWGRAISMASIFIPSSTNGTVEDILPYALALISISSIFLILLFCCSVFSLPMIMHRDVDTITAIISSINAVLRNKLVMTLWALIISLLLLAGLLTMGAGLVIFLPLIGHAIWHGYLETIDGSAFPRHKIGITSTSRNTKT